MLVSSACVQSPEKPALDLTAPPAGQEISKVPETQVKTALLPDITPTQTSQAQKRDASASPVTPTQATAFCLDEATRPIPLPPRGIPLEVRFTNEGDIWVWNEVDPQATQISDAGNAAVFSFSPDGQVIAFRALKTGVDQPEELWAIERDGSDLRRLLSDDQVKTLAGEPTRTDEAYTYGLGGRLVWVAGARRVGFEVLRGYVGLGGCCEFTGRFQIDVDTGEVSPWTPPEYPAPIGLASPDGNWVAVAGEESLSLADAEGRIVHENVLTYESFPADVEFAPSYAPILVWSRDSTSLYATILLENLFAHGSDPNADFAIWQVPVDGEPARELAALSAVGHSFSVSPNQAYMAYLKGAQPGSNYRELHLATVDGSQDLVYARGDSLEFLGWAPDGVHFVFAESSRSSLQWGSVCGSPQSLLDPPGRPDRSRGIDWVDAEHFLIVSNNELRLGKVGGGSRLIGPFSGESTSYQFDRDEAALGG